ncbi:MAG TPA: hypothetical protein VFH95_07175 [Candidatus Kapabacteria bacterium]|nr:hypothetical protein [Candidatus Kapabacteria bacterium]
MITAILIVQMLVSQGFAANCKTLPGEDPGFLGFRLGMRASAALRHEGKKTDVLDRLKSHSGQRVISDTIPLTSCKLPMRRSLGFDSTGTLTAVGITYKTTPDRIQDARDCAYKWLSNMYGPATDEAIRDSTKQEVWKFGPAQLTLEARGYNARDYFVLIYYYKGDLSEKTP